MKLTDKERQDCRIDALADEPPEYLVVVIPGMAQPELCKGSSYRVAVGSDFQFTTQLCITVGAAYITLLREHASRSTKEKIQ